jgi:hypothetical protein
MALDINGFYYVVFIFAMFVSIISGCQYLFQIVPRARRNIGPIYEKNVVMIKEYQCCICVQNLWHVFKYNSRYIKNYWGSSFSVLM